MPCTQRKATTIKERINNIKETIPCIHNRLPRASIDYGWLIIRHSIWAGTCKSPLYANNWCIKQIELKINYFLCAAKLILSQFGGSRLKMLKKQLKAVKSGTQNYIDIPNEKLESIPSELLEVKDQIQNLYLSCNHIEAIDELGQLNYLKEIYQGLNKINSVPKLQNLTNLTHLNLSFNRIEEFPTGLTSCGNLKYLDLNGNRLKTIPPKINLFTDLRSFSIGDNLLINLPKEIGQMKKLEVLVIRNNSITSLPDEIGNLSKLMRLYAQQNQLEVLPSTITSCPLDKPGAVVRLTKNPLVPTLQKAYDIKGCKGIYDCYREGKFTKIMTECKKPTTSQK